MKTDLMKSVGFVCRRFGGTVKAFVAIAALAFTGAAWADIEYKEIDGIRWYYEPYGDGRCKIYFSDAEAAFYPKPSGEVTVPPSLNGLTVAQIGSHAFYKCTDITKVTIPNTVMSIGTSAFEGCSKLERVDVLGESLTSIAQYAFRNCSSLQLVTLPDTITGIGQDAFDNCTSLVRLSLPTGLKTVSFRLFWNCTNLRKVTIPVGASIESNAFQGCSSLEHVIVPISYINDDNLVSNAFPGTPLTLKITYGGTYKTGGYTWEYHVDKTDGSATIESMKSNTGRAAMSPTPEGGVLTIPSTVKNGTVSYTVKALGDSACRGLAGITGVSLPSTLTRIGDYTFYNCKNLASVSIPSTVKTIGMGAFSACSSLTEVTIPASVTGVGLGAFRDCTKLKRAYIESDTLLWSIATDSVFINNASEFRCVSSQVVDGRTWYYTAISSGAVVAGLDHATTLREVTIPSTLGGHPVVAIGAEAFARDPSLERVTIPSGVQSIGRSAFEACEYLNYVYMPDTLQVIGQYAFYGCDMLRSINLPASVDTIHDYAFAGCSSAFITSVRIPDSVTTLGDDAFLGCSNLKSVILPQGLWKANIKDKAFADCSNALALMWTAKYTPAGSTITYTCVMLNETQVQIGDGTGPAIATTIAKDIYLPERVLIRGKDRPVTHIARDAFNGCTKITSVTLSEFVVEIGDRAFRNCAAMKSADLSLAGGLKTIGDEAFYGSGITSLDVPSTVTSVGKKAFSFCPALKTASLGYNVKEYPEELFRGCTSLSEHSFSIYVKSIGESAFKGCTSLKKISTPPSATIGYGAFADCTGLVSAILPEQFYSTSLDTCKSLIARLFANHKAGMELGFYWWQTTPPDQQAEPDFRKSVINGEFWNYTVVGGKAVIGTTLVSRSAVTPDDPTGWLTIPETLGGYPVAEIGKGAFKNCTGITGVTFPGTVTAIHDSAFEGCSGISGVTLPAGLTQIGANAFKGCTKLASVTIPAGVEKDKLGANAFYGCSALKWAYLPKQYATGFVESSVFGNCHEDLVCLTRFDDGYQQGYVQKVNGYSWYFVLINMGTDAEIVSASESLNGDVTVPSTLGGKNVTSIGDAAFYGCSAMTGITLPSTLKSIGSAAFMYCDKLVQVVLPSGVYSLGDSAFTGCAALKQVSLTRNITKIPDTAFSGCTSLFGVYTCDNVATIGQYAFYNCPKLASESINAIIANATTIEVGAFALPSLTSRSGALTVPDSVTTIDQNAFQYSYCGSVSLPESLFGKIDISSVFRGVPSTMGITYRLSDGSFAQVVDGVTWRYTTGTGYKATIIGTDATAATVTVPAKLGSYTVTAIGENAFKDNTTVTWLTIPDSVTEIGSYAFSGCTSLNRTGIGTTSNLKTIGLNAYVGCGLASVTLPDTVTSLGKDDFKNNANLHKASLPGGLYDTRDISYWFSGCAADLVVTFRCDDGDVMAQIVNGYTWYFKSSADSSGVTILFPVLPSDFAGALTIPSRLGGKTVDTIGAEAFKGYTGITSVVIPSTVKTIKQYAFQNCTGLTSVDIPRSVTTIVSYAFKGCTNLASASLPDTLSGSINQSLVFQNCASGISITYRDKSGRTSVVVGTKTWWYRVVDGGAELYYSDDYGEEHQALTPLPTGEVTIPDTLNGYPVTKIGPYAFYGYANMTSVTIPATVTEIDELAFCYCAGLKTINFASGSALLAIRNNAFNHCTSLTSVSLPEGLAIIGLGAFEYCSSLVSVTIPDSIEQIAGAAFWGCEKLASIDLPENLTDIGNSVFRDCKSLTSVTLKSQYAVEKFMSVFDRSYVKNVTIVEGVKTIPYKAFCYNTSEDDYYKALESVTLPESIESIGDYAFAWSRKLKSVTIPAHAESIGQYAFANCPLLTEVSVPAQLTGESLGECVFQYCAGLTTVTFAADAKAVGAKYMFAGCTGITSVTIPDGVTSIDQRTFIDCSNLATLTVPGSVESIGQNAFASTGLTTVHVEARDTARVKDMLVASGLEQSFVDGLTFVEADPDFWFIEFDGNGGVASAARYEVAPSAALGELPTATRGASWEFLGWFTEAEGGEQISAATTATADVTYYAHWKLKQLTVTFDVNGGSSVDPWTVDYGTSLADKGALPEPTRDGYVFKGWVDDGGEPVDVNATITAGSTVHAQWAKILEIELWRVKDGVVDAKWDTKTDIVSGEPLDLGSTSLDGYVFLGWSYEPDGAIMLPDSVIVPTDDLDKLYAQFSLDGWTVTFDPNGGVCGVSETTVEKGGTLASLPVATRAGYKQNGWWTAADGGEEVAAGVTAIDSDVTFYAHWTPVATVDGYTYTYKIEDGKVTIHDETGLVAVSPPPTGTYEIPGVIGGMQVCKIGAGAFQGLPDLLEVVIPDGVTEIGSSAFGNCPMLQTVTIPKSVTTIGTAAFAGCSALARIDVEYGETERVKAMLIASGLDVGGLLFNEAPAPSYMVVFDPVGGEGSAITIAVADGEAIGSVPTPVWAGHSFLGWFTSDGVEVTAETVVTSDISCFAVWNDLNYYAVTLVPNGGTCDKDVIWAYEGATIGVLPVPTRAGHLFNGWWTESEGGEPVTSDFVVTSDGTIFAHWTPVDSGSAVVTFNVNGGTLAEGEQATRTLTKGDPVGMLPSADRTGYTFNGWWTAAVGGEQISDSTPVNEDRTFWANWTPNTYDVVFWPDGGTPLVAMSVTYDSVYSTEDFWVPELAGYDFVGWFTEAEGGTQVYPSDIVKITGTQNLYAHWTETPPPPPDNFTVTFDGNGATVTPSTRTVDNGAAIGALPEPTLDGCTFLGWFTALVGGTEVTAETAVTRDMTIYAHWASTSGKYLDPYGILWSYKIVDDHVEIYAGFGESAIANDTAGDVTVPAEIDGYPVTVIGEYAFHRCGVLTGVTIPEGVTSIGQYAFQLCISIESITLPSTVTYIGEGAFANCNSLKTATYLGSRPETGDSIYYGDTAFEASIVPAAGWEAELEAGAWQYCPIRMTTALTWTYTFDANDGVCDEPMRAVEQGNPIGELPSATRAGYELDGWWSDPVGGWQIQATDVVSGDMTFYAHWTKVEATTWTVAFYAMGGVIVGDDERLVVKGQVIGALPDATREGYTFGGWWTGPDGSGIQYQADYAVTEDLSLYASWTEIPPADWTITFDPNGGTCDEASRTRQDGASIDELPVAVRAGYTQDGWWTDPEGGERVFPYTTVSGDIACYAHWTANDYRVTFDANGTGVPVWPEYTFVTFDSAYGELPVPSNTETLMFVGWYTKAEGGDEVTSRTLVSTDSDHTLYAHWTEGTGSGEYETGGHTVRIEVDELGRAMLWKPNPAISPEDPAYTEIGICAVDPKPEGEYVIPERVGGYLLKFIGPQAFSHCSDMTSLVIPEGVATIGSWVFEGCTSLQAITIPSSLEYIGYNAFVDCLNLKVVYVDSAEDRERVMKLFSDIDMGIDVSKLAFIDKSAAHFNVSFDVGYDGLAPFVREYANGLPIGELEVPVRPGYTFNGWFLDNVEYRNRVREDYIVSSDVTFHAMWTVTQETQTAVVGDYTWSFTLEGKNATIYNNGNTAVEPAPEGHIDVPAKLGNYNVIAIGNRAFSGCDAMTSVKIPDSVKFIGRYAFQGCSALQCADIGKGIAKAGKDAALNLDMAVFVDCSSLAAVQFRGTAMPVVGGDDIFDGVPSDCGIYVAKTAKDWPLIDWLGKNIYRYDYMVDVPVYVMPGAEEGRKSLAGAGTYALGKKVTLKATPASGYVFAGWYDALTGSRLSRATSYAYIVTGEEVEFQADFAPLADDEASLDCNLGGVDLETLDDGTFMLDLNDHTTSLSEPKVTFKNLPTGLKYDAKTFKVSGKATKPGIYKVTLSLSNTTVKKAKTYDFTIKVPNLYDAIVDVGDEYGPYIPGVEYTETFGATASDWSVTGLPTGMKWTNKAIVDTKTKVTKVEANSIYGAPSKPGNYTVYFTKTVKEIDEKTGRQVSVKHTSTATFVVSDFPVLSLEKDGKGFGKMSGDGAYPANKKVSLKATANAGSVFHGWYQDGILVSQAATYSYEMPEYDTTLYAHFITAAEDKAGIWTIFNNEITFIDDVVSMTKSIPCGVYLEWPLDVNALSLPTVKVAGLPTGLKFTAKDIIDSKTKEVIVPANTIYGTPTAASKVDAKTGVVKSSEIKITVTTAGKTTVNYKVVTTVDPMQDWAVGTFEGGTDENGLATLTVKADGKISGKLLDKGLTWTLSANNFDEYDEAAGKYTATVIGKSGQATFTEKLYISKEDLTYISGTASGNLVGLAEIGDHPNVLCGLVQYNWKADPWKTIAKDFKQTLTFGGVDYDCPGNVTVTIKNTGAVTAAGVFGTYKASASAMITPVTWPDESKKFYAFVQIYFPRDDKKGFAGYGIRLPLTWNGSTFTIGMGL